MLYFPNLLTFEILIVFAFWKVPNSWIAVSHSTSVNGGGKHAAGCLAAIGWLGMGSNQGIAKMVIMSMITGELFVEWTSEKGMGYQNFPVMAMHLGYTALGLWGNGDRAAPTVLLFHVDRGNTTLMKYATSGSVMAIDMVYTPYTLLPSPAYTAAAATKGAAEAAPTVHVIAGSKLEHATMRGRGGQCVVFQVPGFGTLV